MALRKKGRKELNIPEAELNITSLMDVMTVLLFFLIKSFTVSSSLALNPPEGVRLPASSVETQPEESLSIAVSNKEIRVDNEVIVKLQNGHFSPDDLDADQRTLIALKAVLDKESEKRTGLYEGAGDLSFLPPGKFLLQADKNLKFEILKHVLHTAALSGYSDYQFVVVPKDGG